MYQTMGVQRMIIMDTAGKPLYVCLLRETYSQVCRTRSKVPKSVTSGENDDVLEGTDSQDAEGLEAAILKKSVKPQASRRPGRCNEG